MGQYTGFSEDKVNSLMREFNKDSENLLEALTKQYNKVLDKLGENWGTHDSIQYVDENVITGFTQTGQQIAAVVQSIGATIQSVAQLQAADTNNSVSINDATLQQLGSLKNCQKEKLSNGFVGVYTELKTEVAAAVADLGTEVKEKLAKLRSNLVANASVAFTDEGVSKVSEQADTVIGTVQSKIEAQLTKLEEDVNTLTANASQYVKDIQAAGLRQSSN